MAINVVNIGHSAVCIENKIIQPGQSGSVSSLSSYVQALINGGVLYLGSSYTYPAPITPATNVASNTQIVPFSSSISVSPTFTDGTIVISNITGSFSLNLGKGALGQKARFMFVSNAASATLTWGPNIKTGASTCSVGAIGTTCLWSFIFNGTYWIGDNEVAAGPIWK